MSKKQIKTDVVSMKITPALNARLVRAAEKARLPKAALAQMALEAAIEAIEQNGNRLVVPIEFEVSHIPTPLGKTEAPAARGTRPVAAAGGRSSDSTERRPTNYRFNEKPAPRTTEEPSDSGSA